MQPTAVLGATSVNVLVKADFPATASQSVPLARLTFSSPISAALLPAPVLVPSLNTSWQQIGAAMVQLVVNGPLAPATSYSLMYPTGIHCDTTCTTTSVHGHIFTITGSVRWLQELLATLDYLPVHFTPLTGSVANGMARGTFHWRFNSLPVTLRALWRDGSANVIEKGAIMRFQDVHHLRTSGVADTATWSMLLKAIAKNELNPTTYNYVDVTTTRPQTLRLFVNGALTFSTAVNAGISAAPTSLRTDPVYLRYSSQTMSGTNPDGSVYRDPGIPWVSYFHGGEALHGFKRYTYGWPQSLGCIEMRFADAKIVWPFTPIGTLVTIR